MTIDARIRDLTAPAPLWIELREGLPFGPTQYDYQVSKTDTTPVDFTGVDSASCIITDPRSGRTVAVGTAETVSVNPGEVRGFTLAFDAEATGKIRSQCLANPRTTDQPQEAGRLQVFFHDADGSRYMITDGPCLLRFAGSEQ